jgi:hypothetical protein
VDEKLTLTSSLRSAGALRDPGVRHCHSSGVSLFLIKNNAPEKSSLISSCHSASQDFKDGGSLGFFLQELYGKKSKMGFSQEP